MTHRGPFQPRPFCDSVILVSKTAAAGDSPEGRWENMVHWWDICLQTAQSLAGVLPELITGLVSDLINYELRCVFQIMPSVVE